ncbi:hypothetical protein CA13_34760 [Planctomycetes bacterium CA13]|uniref:Uncharacterized protein n=1 Tax=Novipirellula herctigrandis TaxID=2527986 RepID=A0A5C5Z5C5_9BACT|nr:hypothetical protein CA13_34760 [Planctomycetes bacterium CA13]
MVSRWCNVAYRSATAAFHYRGFLDNAKGGEKAAILRTRSTTIIIAIVRKDAV